MRSDLPTDEELREFAQSNLGQSIKRGQSSRDEVFIVEIEPSCTGVRTRYAIGEEPENDRRGSMGAIWERIANPENPFPFNREFAIKRWELLAWLDGRNPSYRPKGWELAILKPAYAERLRRIRASALRTDNGPSDSLPLEPDVALKSTENNEKRTYRLRDLWVHVRGYDEHGGAYGVAADEQAGLHTAWRPLRHELRKRAPAGQSDRELLEDWLDHLEHDKGFNRTDLLNVPLNDWRGLLADPSPPVPREIPKPIIAGLPKTLQRLLDAVWQNIEFDSMRCKVQSVVLDAWGDEEKQTTALRSTICRLNNRCLEVDVHLTIRKAGDYLEVEYRQ